MELQFFHIDNLLLVDGKEYKATCRVRNEINGERFRDQVVNTFPKNNNIEISKPYYPRPFPLGCWEIKHPIWTDDINYWPVKIPTMASQMVRIWSEANGQYLAKTDEVQEDAFYHLHYAKNSRTTLGCIRLHSEQDAIDIAEAIEKELQSGNKVFLDVLIGKDYY